ncbi:ABC transporter permease subunit [Deinococcus hopiensis]|uniref:Amino acid/amide ABC transporter membrane protein 2, HAAT family /amino acid/amide ABC transporter ATP-binding protein 1, HAAT family n=1 Tax=Deinococcus hopiensis KR-140 TaxID=695939 RepID=A0A1W1UCH5_9DEIO|nr:branched-chain amino acid ABC transporter ATP-binding protein/permease [Deinococcus hopiensis]SMB78777.1 amino acid/amide ABC transporter membrane protein 2, HAAT family /amino acid/amide ABC transporter ATP-binding protein 1, HAAT family [Deinococcus hopiensis KR-140]
MKGRAWLGLLAVAGAALLPLLLPVFQVTLLTNVAIAALTVVGLVLLTGVSGLTSFGQAAFMGVGAYTTAVLTTQAGWNPWLTLVAGMGVTSAVAAILGLATLRMQGHYLPLATIAWGISLYYVFGNSPQLGGFTGVRGIPPISLFGLTFSDPRAFAYLALLFLGLGIIGAQFLLSSRTGRALRALRTGTVVAEAFGAPTFRLRVQVFVLSALLASVAGWLYAHQQRFVNPTPFGLNVGIEYLFMAVLGGAGHIWGAVAGSAILILLREGLQDALPRLLGTGANFETVVLGVLIILVLQFAPRGLWALMERLIPAGPPRLLPHPAALPAPTLPSPGTPVLEVDHAVKRFGGLSAVQDVSFTVNSGEIVGLIGPNGAGKSTLFNLITGVNPATSGMVRILGRDVTRLPARTIHRLGVARTFQHVRLFPELSLLENAMMGGYARGRAGMAQSLLHLERREEAALQQAALAALQRVGLQDRAADRAGNLALGQQRLLEIARALTAEPALLLLDEPAAGLRYGEKAELSALLRRLREEGMTILIVEHDMDLVMNLVDRLVVMNSGQPLAQGTPAEVRANAAVREAYLGADVEVNA